MRAALELFADKGVERTSVDEITASAAVAKGTFYVHFSRKEDVLLEHAARIVAHVDDTQLEGPLEEALGRLASHVATATNDTPRPLAGRMIREVVGHREDWERVLGDRRTLSRVVAPIIERAQQAGVARTDLSPRRLAQGLTILWLDTIIGWAERPVARDLEEDLRRATRIFLDGVRAR